MLSVCFPTDGPSRNVTGESDAAVDHFVGVGYSFRVHLIHRQGQ